MRVGRLAPIALAMLALGGCMLNPPPEWLGPPPQKMIGNAACMPPGRVLVVARLPNDGNRSTAEAATASLVSVLRASSDVVSASELEAEAASMALGAWASGMVARLQGGGGRPTPEEARILFERFRITTLIVSDLSEYDQVWGRDGKFTRATIDGQAVDLVADIPLWRVRGRAEVDEMRGRSFEFAMEQAVQQLADGICHQPKPFNGFKLLEIQRYWRR